MALLIDRPLPFEEAIGFLQRKHTLRTTLTSKQLQRLPADIRRAAKFSARVANAEFIQEAYDLVDQIVDPSRSGAKPGTYMDTERAVEILMKYLGSIGYSPDPDKAGTLEDLSSHPRLKLIADLNTRMARGYGQFVQANTEGALDAFPCQELFRLKNVTAVARGTARDWVSRWQRAGGQIVGGGRMIALKNDEIWTRISTFGNPYPPFDWNSGMWTKPVSREEAVELGVITDDTKVEPNEVAMSDGMQASAQGFAKALQDSLVKSFDGHAKIVDGVLKMNAGFKMRE
jgi:hypothetical protein